MITLLECQRKIDLAEKWSKEWGIVSDLPVHQRRVIATLLHNQKELMTSEGSDYPANLQGLLTDMTFSIWKDSPLFDLVSVQALVAPNDTYFYFNRTTKKLEFDNCSAATRTLKATFGFEAAQDLMNTHGIDASAALGNMISQDIRGELFREVAEDLKGVAVKNLNLIEDSDDPEGAIAVATDEIDCPCGGLNWAITSPDMAKRVWGFTHDSYSSMISRVFVDDLIVYIDPLYPKNEILVGHKCAGDYESDYAFGVYTPLILMPSFLDPSSFIPTRRIAIRRAKRILPANNDYVYPYFTIQIG